MKVGKKYRVIVIAAAGVLAAVLVIYALWPRFMWVKYAGQQRFRHPAEKNLIRDLNKNGWAESYRLKNGRLTIADRDSMLWRSPFSWWVDDFQLADANNDGTVDIVMSVWKQGNFGRFFPFWIQKNDRSIRNHLFLFNFKRGIFAPVWQSSNLERPNCAFEIRPVAGFPGNSLAVIEGDYSDMPDCVARYNAIWSWNGWGFANESRSPVQGQ